MRTFLLLFLSCCFALSQTPDWRNILNGSVIPDESYADQPYVVKTKDGAWLMVMTTGSGAEGAGGQHVISARSTDRGRSWEKAVDVEPSSGPEASYAVLLQANSGRVYVFYNHNTDNTRKIIADKPTYKDGFVTRVDSQGHFVFKYSDDNGKSWSSQRYEVPMRDFEIDRQNPYAGRIKFFWNVGKAFAYRGAGYVPVHKVGGFGEGFFTSSEGALLRSANILTERDPNKIEWQTLPDGDLGIRTPKGGGPIAEEQSFAVLSDGSMLCVFRTIDGHSAFTYSRDGGRSWEPSQYMRYADGRLIKHPRAANFVWRCENGKFLYWFHNHGGRFIRESPNRRTIAYEDRNPVWLSGGVELDSPQGKVIRWSQPEIVLYDDDPLIRISYPDLVEEGGEYYLTETQKDVARVHQIDKTLLAGLWSQDDAKSVPKSGLILDVASPKTVAAPALPVFLRRSRRADYGSEHSRAGVSIEVELHLRDDRPGQVLVDNRSADGKGFALLTAEAGAVEIVLQDGRTENRWQSDPGVLSTAKRHHVVAIVDAGPNLITFVVDGKLSDGGDTRQFGFGRFSPNLYGINGSPVLRFGEFVLHCRLYGRALRTSEAIGAFRAVK
ncbi:sialidase family protein [Bryobacter aggregatus]|uniref:sialidase family protein n=1 Tax=Bryobacter aggregatus TaxID=360054 RepID=UPI00068B72F2|nr:sialidase family protein [Bryobacter aggregatus]